MIELKVGKKDITLPERLTISQYQRLREIGDASKDPIGFVRAISGLEEDEIKYANKKDMDFVFHYLVENYLGKGDKRLQTTIELNGVEYGLMSQIHTLNFGGWVDLEFLTTDGVDKNIGKIMALMYRPITKKTDKGFEIEDYDHDSMIERSELFMELPVDYFWGVSSFFFNLVKAYTENMKASLEYQRTKEKALTRLRMINPLTHLSKLYQGFTGLVLCRYVKRTLQRLKK